MPRDACVHVLAKSLNGGIYIHDIAILSEGSQLIRPPFNRVAVLDPRLHSHDLCSKDNERKAGTPTNDCRAGEHIYRMERADTMCRHIFNAESHQTQYFWTICNSCMSAHTIAPSYHVWSHRDRNVSTPRAIKLPHHSKAY